MAKPMIEEPICIRLKLPRRAWPEALTSFAAPARTAVRLIRGRLTRRQAVLLIRLEGAVREVKDALHRWERSGFKVDPLDGSKLLPRALAP